MAEIFYVSEFKITETLTLAAVEALYVDHVLESFGGNKTQAAKALGIDRRTLYRKLEDKKRREKR